MSKDLVESNKGFKVETPVRVLSLFSILFEQHHLGLYKCLNCKQEHLTYLRGQRFKLHRSGHSYRIPQVLIHIHV